MRPITRSFFLPALLAVAAALQGIANGVYAGVADTPHNLSVTGPGPVKATEETQICVFCHTPHNASPNSPLWNRRDPGSTYTPYSSSTTMGSPGQPTGASILCLSCHDGTIALGEVLSQPVPITLSGGVTTIPSGPGRLGTDLSDDHPISFNYSSSLANQRGELADPATLTGVVRLDGNGELQCTACHNPHENTYGKFLVMSNQGGALCNTCHQKNPWSQSSHSLSNATWNGLLPDPWPHTPWNNVAANACENCHRPHTAGGRQRLLNFQIEEDNCTVCHNANVASTNIFSEFNKFSFHPIADTTGVHDPGEPTIVDARHVECVDCHNPHAARSGTGAPSGPLAGVKGINIAGGEVDPISLEYQLCFRCHADSPNKPGALTPRQISQTNVRLEFETSNPSFHPVAGAGKNTNVPSLLPPLTTISTIACTDCHNNNSGPGAGGGGPNGPHGSSYTPILERQYVTTDNTAESSSVYALCYKCHNRTSILNDDSFARHRRHIVDVGAPCNVCHDPHGISGIQGNNTNNTHLINFDTSIVFPNNMGQLSFVDGGLFRGSCSLLCHGRNHHNAGYGGMGGGM